MRRRLLDRLHSSKQRTAALRPTVRPENTTDVPLNGRNFQALQTLGPAANIFVLLKAPSGLMLWRAGQGGMIEHSRTPEKHGSRKSARPGKIGWLARQFQTRFAGSQAAMARLRALWTGFSGNALRLQRRPQLPQEKWWIGPASRRAMPRPRRLRQAMDASLPPRTAERPGKRSSKLACKKIGQSRSKQ